MDNYIDNSLSSLTNSTKKPLSEFNIDNAPTEGLYLIEANAGTGKTFSLVSLYLKFLFNGYSASEIMAVTFSRAATRELSMRIKASLEELLFRSRQKINLPVNPQVDFFLTLLEDMDDKTKTETLTNLRDAVVHLEDYPIQTIDSFMTGLLNDNSFELGQFREKELLEDSSALIDEVYRDFIRTYFNDYLFLNDKEENHYFLHYLFSKENLFSSSPSVRSLKNKYLDFIIQPNLVICPKLEPIEENSFIPLNLVETLGKGFATLTSFQLLICNHQSEMESLLANEDRTFLKLVGSARKASIIKSWLEQIKSLDLKEYPIYFQPILDFEELIRDISLKDLRDFCDHQDKESLWAKEFFTQIKKIRSIVTQLHQTLERNHLTFLHFFIGTMREKIRQKKEELGVFFYSDPTRSIGEVLKKKKAVLEGKHRAFLIDEFQDTDPEQYAVFSRIISLKQAQAKPVVAYFIGDPKQSIYRFRRANLETYFSARKKLTTYSLIKNYRTHENLLKQVNGFFSNQNLPTPNSSPFCNDNLAFTPSSADNTVVQKLEKKYPPALFSPFFYLHRPDHSSDKSETYSKEKLQVYFINQLVTHLSLVQKESSSLYATVLSNTAILVGTNGEVSEIKRLLDAKNVPSVVESEEKIDQTKEFLFLKTLLKAVLLPTAKNICAPFVWLGLTPPDDAFKRFDSYLEIWQKKSFAPLLKIVFDDYFFEAALLQEGARAHTNFFHLVDMMIFLEKKTPTPLALFEKVHSLQPQDLDQFDTALRSEASGVAAVKIMTIHKSKGLEYDFVHILYPNKKNGINSQDYYLLNQADNSVGILNFKNLIDEEWLQNKEEAIKEEISENLRKLYVALTRGKLQVNLYIGHKFLPEEFKSQDNKTGTVTYANAKTPLRWLLKDSSLYDKSCYLIKNEYSDKLNKGDNLPFIVEIRKEDIEPSSISLGKVGGASEDNANEFYVHPTPPKKNSYQTSFTALSSHSHLPKNSMLIGEEVSPSPLVEAVDDIAHLRGGVATGNFFHSLIEQWNFSTDDNHLQRVFSYLVKRYPYFEKYQAVVLNSLEQLKGVELFDQFTFKDFHGQNANMFNWLNELEFMLTLKKEESLLKEELYLYLNSVGGSLYPDDDRMINLKRKLPSNQGDNLGVVKGFIDLVVEYKSRYYIIDWKTNTLGNSLADYHANALAQAIKESSYQLQALIYLVGLERHLKSYLPDYDYDRHIGGVNYVFLRGLAHSETRGVVDLTPQKKEFEEFKQLFG